MEIKQIKELMAVMGRTGTQRLMLKKEGFEPLLERQQNGAITDHLAEAGEDLLHHQGNALQRASITLAKLNEPKGVPGAGHHEKESAEEMASVYVTSPMVGTFYACPSTDDPPFVKPGDTIEKHTVVCIIEAMKVMNEVKAGVAGTIAEILVENGHPVEFGTKLFRIS